MFDVIYQSHEHIRKAIWLLALLFIFQVPLTAQESTPAATPTTTPPATIEFTGMISVVMESSIVVNGLTVLTTNVEDMEATLAVDMRVKVEGQLLPDGTVQATEIEIRDDEDDVSPTPVASGVPSATAVPDSTRTLNPPPIMPSGTPSITPTATDVDDDDSDTEVIIVIEGPVEAIEINIVIIYGFEIVLDENDPVLTVIRIGDVIRVEGVIRDDDDDTGIIIVAVDITFINVIVIIIDGRIWREPDTCAPLPGWVPPADVEIYIARCARDDGRGGGRGGGGDNDDDDD